MDKVIYENGKTIITAEHLNAMQDAIIDLENGVGDIPAALENIIAIQEQLIGGDGE